MTALWQIVHQDSGLQLRYLMIHFLTKLDCAKQIGLALVFV